uniref:Serpentine receptor class gamma n=1 Tax=Panagrolaimus sp. PS1159 TaxID=55785 RepID=A0AC35FS66_9BILA
MNLYVVGYLVYQQYKNMAGKPAEKTSPHNIKLFCFNLLVFGGQLAAGILQLLFVFTPTPANLEFFKIQVYVNDFNNLTPPWFLIALSTTLRREIVRQMCCVDTESNKVTVINSSTVNTAGNHVHPSRSL